MSATADPKFPSITQSLVPNSMQVKEIGGKFEVTQNAMINGRAVMIKITSDRLLTGKEAETAMEKSLDKAALLATTFGLGATLKGQEVTSIKWTHEGHVTRVFKNIKTQQIISESFSAEKTAEKVKEVTGKVFPLTSSSTPPLPSSASVAKKEEAEPLLNVSASLSLRSDFALNGVKVVVRQGEITKERADIIVTSARGSLLTQGGVDRLIREASKDDLGKVDEECREAIENKRKAGERAEFRAGEAVITSAGALKEHGVGHIIHAIAPDVEPLIELCRRQGVEQKFLIKEGKFFLDEYPEVYRMGMRMTAVQARLDLKNAYMNALMLALDHKATSVAFPLLGTSVIGNKVYGIPEKDAAEMAMEAITKFTEMFPQAAGMEVRFIMEGTERKVVDVVDTFIEEAAKREQKGSNPPALPLIPDVDTQKKMQSILNLAVTKGGYISSSMDPAVNFLGNHYPCKVLFGEKKFQCAEGAYQWKKFQAMIGDEALKKDRRFEQLETLSGDNVTKLSQELDEDYKKFAIEGWVKEAGHDIMKQVLEIKFKDPKLAALLRATGDAYLLEHRGKEGESYWSDNNNGEGLNMLGQMLSHIRAGEEIPPSNASITKWETNRIHHFAKKAEGKPSNLDPIRFSPAAIKNAKDEELPLLKKSQFIDFNMNEATSFLSNTVRCEIKLWEHTFQCAKAAYLWRRYDLAAQKNPQLKDDPSFKGLLTAVGDGVATLEKNLKEDYSKKKALPDNWVSSQRDEVMWEVLQAKFAQHSEMLADLKKTGNAFLLNHDREEGDRYWSDNHNGNGANRLGEMLEAIRSDATTLPLKAMDPRVKIFALHAQ